MVKGPTEAKITLGGEEYPIKKLKAGKFYEVQKLFAEIIASVGTEEGINDAERLSNILSNFPEKVLAFVAKCAELEDNDIREKAYPEEVSAAFGECMKLNNVFENLKNSVAPMEKLVGAKPEEKAQVAPQK